MQNYVREKEIFEKNLKMRSKNNKGKKDARTIKGKK